MVVALLAAGVYGAQARAQAPPQPKRYRLMLGASLNSLNAFDNDVGTDLGPGVLARGVPRPGFGPVVDYAVFQVDLQRGSTGEYLGNLRMRAPILGVGYTIGSGNLQTTFHVAAGWAFNRIETDPQLINAANAEFEVKNRPLLRAGITFTRSLGERFALVSSIGGLAVEPSVALAFRDGQRTVRTETGTWKPSGLFWGIGAAYKVF